MNIRDEITLKRKRRIEKEGFALGIEVPSSRRYPLVPFGRDPFIICEVKRRSPSKGNIAGGLDAVEQAGIYAKAGVPTVSVLTEEDYFSGTLRDLMEIKGKYPFLSVLRKDFLFHPEDIDISWRAGADAVLLIASILDEKTLREMYSRAESRGISCLVEVHDEEDIAAVRGIAPAYTGINSRDLTTFRTDPVYPLTVADRIDWPTELVFESGIFTMEDSLFASVSGFSGILVGEAVVKNPGLIGPLTEGLVRGREGKGDFWRRLYGRKKKERPLLKVCGITSPPDGELACSLGADILGFIFAPSPRKSTAECVESLTDLSCLKVGVVVLGPEDLSLPAEVAALLDKGLLDAVQFHGDESPDQCFSLAFPYFKALRARDEGLISRASDFGSPRVLWDGYSKEVYGGSGTRISPEFLRSASKRGPLWIAGGISAENVRQIIDAYAPELIDVSSGLEKEPGKKDKYKLKKFFQEIDHAGK